MERGTIESSSHRVHARRTLNDSFIILDEAQNTTLRANEDVPDPDRVRLQGRGYR